MHYTTDVRVLPSNTADNHVEVPIKFSAGIIKHVSILFPPGCVRQVYCTIWDGAEQLLPTNMDATYHEDDYTVEIDCYFPTFVYGNKLYILAWNVGCSYAHNLHVMFDVQGVDEPDITKSIDVFNNVIQTLVDLIKGWF